MRTRNRLLPVNEDAGLFMSRNDADEEARKEVCQE